MPRLPATYRATASYSSVPTSRESGSTSLRRGFSGRWLCVEYITAALP